MPARSDFETKVAMILYPLSGSWTRKYYQIIFLASFGNQKRYFAMFQNFALQVGTVEKQHIDRPTSFLKRKQYHVIFAKVTNEP